MADIDRYFRRMVEIGASDLHISPGNPPKLRKSGELHPIEGEPILNDEINRKLLYEIMNEEQIKQFEETCDVDFAYAIEDIGSRFRCNIFKERKAIGAVFRLIPTKIKTVEELGIPESVLIFAKLNKGLVVVTGATGSGKSTTLAAIIDYINKNYSKHIITIEDPIEFVHTSQKCLITQREVGHHSNSFSTALKASLREDPDVILVGEMRDLETIELAITAAETGQLVFGTLHTNSAAKTVDRIINVFPVDAQEQIRAMLSESLKGVVAQQLLKNVEGGRNAALEILIATPGVSNLIREGKTHQIPSVIQTSKKDGMQSMDQAIMECLKAKKITPEEAASKAFDKRTFEPFLKETPQAAPASN